MGEFLSGAFTALPAIATSPLAFVAYIAVVVVWAIISWKVRRSKELLTSLQKFPEKDRLDAWKVEAGIAHLGSGLSPEQWIRSKIQLYYLLGFSIVFICLVMIFAITAATQIPETIYVGAGILVICLLVILIAASQIVRRGTVSVDITPYQEPKRNFRE
jgi:hypothetical protein